MSGWVAIPQAAIAAAGREGRAAVLDLYDVADRTGYAPRQWTEREIADEWGVDRRTAVRIIESLEAAGVLEVTRATPGSRRPSILRVVPVHQTGSQTGRQTRNHKDAPPKPVRAESVPDAAPDPVPDTAPARAELFARAQTRPDQTEEPTAPAAPKARKPSPRSRAGIDQHVRQFSDAWVRAWTASGQLGAYPFALPGADGHRLREGAAATGWVDGDSPTEEQVGRYERAVEAYLYAVDRGDAFPRGEPPTLHHFTRDIAKWLQVSATGPPARAAPAYHRAPPPEPEAEIRRPPPRRAPP